MTARTLKILQLAGVDFNTDDVANDGYYGKTKYILTNTVSRPTTVSNALYSVSDTDLETQPIAECTTPSESVNASESSIALQCNDYLPTGEFIVGWDGSLVPSISNITGQMVIDASNEKLNCTQKIAPQSEISSVGFPGSDIINTVPEAQENNSVPSNIGVGFEIHMDMLTEDNEGSLVSGIQNEPRIVTEVSVHDLVHGGTKGEVLPERENTIEVITNENPQADTGNSNSDVTRKKRKIADISEWSSTKNKINRMHGIEYSGTKKKEDGKWDYKVEKNPREMKPPCNCAMSKQSSTIMCGDISEDNRKVVFEEFWRASWDTKRAQMRHLVDKVIPKDKRNMKSEESRRSNTLFFHLKVEGTRKRVCKQMFLNTLCVGEWSVHNWLKDTSIPNEKLEHKSNLRTKNSTKDVQKSVSEGRKKLVDFFNGLPKMESHYCRASTSKIYLEPVWASKANLHREYQNYCHRLGVEPISIKPFYIMFDEMNLSLFSPKKDMCDLCCSYRAGNASEDVYISHIQAKDAAREEKGKDKIEAKFVFTIDLQSVLLCPSLQASALYYKMKLKVHNFTIFDLKTGEGYCFLWHEGEGGLSANEFASIICDFILTQVSYEAGDEVIFYSDGCGYQNRNCILANALLNVSQSEQIIITQKYLTKGHTQMECDSMHSTIERKLRRQEIFTPAGYVNVCKMARLHPKPYNVTYLDHSFFKDYSTVKYLSSIRPGSRQGDPTVADITCIQYLPGLKVRVKTNFKGT